MDNPERWNRSVDEHKQLLEALRTGDPDFAEAHLARTFRKFASDTFEVLTQ